MWEWLKTLGAPRYSLTYSLSSGRRAPGWEKAAREFLQAHPTCHLCGTKAEIECHHTLPFHLYPEFELDPTKFMALCRLHHLEWGHLGDWKAWNPDVLDDVAAWAKKRKDRPYRRLAA